MDSTVPDDTIGERHRDTMSEDMGRICGFLMRQAVWLLELEDVHLNGMII